MLGYVDGCSIDDVHYFQLLYSSTSMFIVFRPCVRAPPSFKRGRCYQFVREELENNTTVDH